VTKKATKTRRSDKPSGHAKKAPKPEKAKVSKAKAHKAKDETHKKSKAAEHARVEAHKAAAAAAAAKVARKGITIVSPKPPRKTKPAAASISMVPAGLGRLLDPKGPIRKPLIPSGPKAVAQRPLGQHGGTEVEQPRPAAITPFDEAQLNHFRSMLQRKRQELVGDVSTMETQALRSQSGSLSNMPSHLAEQGSEAYDQSLSLDLAAADRKLIKEIDDALRRIALGTYGICELTGKPIKLERLEELPWARYSIEAARELERQSMRAV
jgi:RNA polymerase-binding protein DksA